MKHVFVLLLLLYVVSSRLNYNQLGECIETILDIYPFMNLYLFQYKSGKYFNVNLEDTIVANKQRTVMIINKYYSNDMITSYEFYNYNHTDMMPPVGNINLIVTFDTNMKNLFDLIRFYHLNFDDKKVIETDNTLVIDTNGHISRLINACDNDTIIYINECSNLNLTIVKQEYENTFKDLQGCDISYDLYADIDMFADEDDDDDDEEGKGIPFTVSLNHNYDPLDVRILKEMSKMLNFICNSTTSKIIEVTENPYLSMPTYPYYISQYVIPVPLAKRIPNGLRNVFDLHFWRLLIATFIIYFAAYYLLIIHTDQAIKNEFSYICLQLFAVLFTQGVTFPKRYLMKCLLFTWVFFSFIIFNTYTGLSYKHNVEFAYGKQISTLKDVQDANISICMGMLIDLSDLVSLAKCLENVGDGKVTLILPSGSVNPNEFYKIYLHNYLVSMHIEKGHSIYFEFNKLLQRFIEIGLIQQWSKEAMFVKTNIDKNDGPVPLNSNHLLFIYAIYLSGMFIATLIFIFESCLDQFYKYY